MIDLLIVVGIAVTIVILVKMADDLSAMRELYEKELANA